jgi:hypothetical protein
MEKLATFKLRGPAFTPFELDEIKEFSSWLSENRMEDRVIEDYETLREELEKLQKKP